MTGQGRADCLCGNVHNGDLGGRKRQSLPIWRPRNGRDLAVWKAEGDNFLTGVTIENRDTTLVRAATDPFAARGPRERGRTTPQALEEQLREKSRRSFLRGDHVPNRCTITLVSG